MAETVSFEELVASRVLEVPDYQRGYAWGRQQLDEFWEDLDLLEPGQRHYTGTVVLQARSGSVVDEDRNVPLGVFDVVDGQQRLTTCTILLNQLYAALDSLGDEDARSNRRRLLTVRVSGIVRPKLQLGSDNATYWQTVILGGQPLVDGAAIASQKRLDRASAFFADRLREAADALDNDAYLAYLRSTAGKVVGSLQFTLYTADDEAEVGVIFETLNQRGKPLSELEKTKNYLLFLASRLEGDQRSALTSKINTTWHHIFVNLGRLSVDHEDQFLRAHWLAAQNPNQRDWARVNSVKARFHRRDYVGAPDKLFGDVHRYVSSLGEASSAYRGIVSVGGANAFEAYGRGAPEIRLSARNLQQAGVIQIFAPLLIAARLRFPTDGEPYLALLNICERYSVRVFLIMERRSNAGQARLYSVAKFLHDSGDWKAALAAVIERIGYFASDAELVDDLRNTRRNWYAKPGHKYLLYQYELKRLGGDHPPLAFEHFTAGEFKASSTEHILPQSPNDECWLGTFTEAQRSELTHSLGNIVLTYDNSVYGRRCFNQKRDGVAGSASYGKSVLRQEQDLAEFEDWNPQSIETRQQTLADFALERWAVPGAGTNPADILDQPDEDDEPGAADGPPDDVWDETSTQPSTSSTSISIPDPPSSMPTPPNYLPNERTEG